MFRIIKIIAAVLALLIGAIIAAVFVFREPQPEGTPPADIAVESSDHAAAIAVARERAMKQRADDFYPSMSVSVYRSGVNIWTEAFGYRDLRSENPATTATVYPIGSVSKSFTAATAMRLAERGAIDLDENIRVAAPELPQSYDGVTLRQLLSHQAGVRHYGFAWTPPVFTENGLNKEFPSTRESLSLFIDDPLLFEPDQSFQYSTYGYTLISYVLEQATGEAFLDLLRDELFATLNLSSLQPDVKPVVNANRSTDYMAMMRKIGVFRSPETNSSYKWAGGGLMATPADMAKFADALLRGEVLGAAAFEEMTTARTLPSGEMNPQQYGLGWRIGGMTYPRESDALSPIIHHGGTAAGSECALLMAPEFETSVAVCANAFTGGSGGLIVLAANIVRDLQDHAGGAAAD